VRRDCPRLIADDGSGIPDRIKSEVFDHEFSTESGGTVVLKSRS
jgi:nitrogen-specific signal transduction histidine kinase